MHQPLTLFLWYIAEIVDTGKGSVVLGRMAQNLIGAGADDLHMQMEETAFERQGAIFVAVERGGANELSIQISGALCGARAAE